MASTSMTSGQGWLVDPGLELPRRPERHLLAPAGGTAALQRPVTLGELIRQLEEIAERLDAERGPNPPAPPASATASATPSTRWRLWPTARNCPETTAALSQFLLRWPQAAGVVRLSKNWWPPGPRPIEATTVPRRTSTADRVGVFWALLFLCHQGQGGAGAGTGACSARLQPRAAAERARACSCPACGAGVSSGCRLAKRLPPEAARLGSLPTDRQ
jgi:segregation and condensation protein A